MALLSVIVKKTDGQEDTYPVLPVTIVAFERNFKRGFAGVGEDLHMEHVYWLGWDSEKRSGKVVKLFDDWLEDVVDVEAESDATPLAGEAIHPS